MGAVTPPVLRLLITALLLPKVVSSCDDISECQTVSVQASTSQINVTGLPEGFFLQNITETDGNVTQVFDNGLNKTSLVSSVSGTQYVIHYGNGTISCCRNVTTKPLPIQSLQTGNVTSSSVLLTWSKPDVYKMSYSYRVQTIVTSSSTMMSTTIVTSESATIMNLTAGETYTFMVYTRAADNLTESDPVSRSTCTVPGQVSSISVNTSVTVLGVSWISPVGKVDNYTVNLIGIMNITTSNSSTQVNFTGLLPGREYNVTVETVSGNCSRPSTSVTEATYPTEPEQLSFNAIATKSLTLSWVEPVNMTDVNKSYNISYGISPSTNLTVASNATNVTLQNLTSGTKYSITVVTIGVRGYPSLPVGASVYTKPISVKSLQTSNLTSHSVSLMWNKPEEYQSLYSYRVQTNDTSSAALLNDTVVTSESATIRNLTPGEMYTFMVYTRAADNITESEPVSHITCTEPIMVKSLRTGNVTSYSVSLTWGKPDEFMTSYSYRVQTNITSSATKIYDTIVTRESATIMNLTPGDTYTFLVYTRAADNVTESEAASQSICTAPGRASVSLNNYKSVDFLGAVWTKPAGKVDNYTVILTGDVNRTIQTDTTQVNFTGLLPGREYSVTLQTVSGNCSRPSTSVTEATYPTEPGTLSFNTISTSDLMLSWVEPVNMTDVNKSYNISYGISPFANLSVASNTRTVTLQNLISGSNYLVTVVTIGVRGHQSSAVSASVYTKPISVSSLQTSNVTSYSVSLTWNKPDGYKTSYSYRVQTNVSSPATMRNDTIVKSESATIRDLTPGEIYTFIVYTTAGDNITESDPVSQSTCTAPGRASVSLNNYKSVDFLGAVWTKPAGKVDNYTVILTGDVNSTIQTDTTQVNFTGLLPGREYNVTVETVSGNCSRPSTSVTEATYPTQPRNLTINTIGTNNLTLSWMEPVNMSGVIKSYNVSYGSSSSTRTMTDTRTNVVLQNLTSGTDYSITVVTVGVRGYLSLPAITSVYTKPKSVRSLQISNFTTNSVSLTWSKPDEHKASYSYRVQTNVTSSATVINTTFVTNESATIMNLTAGETYTFIVYTRAADNITESDPESNSTCTGLESVLVTMNNYNSVSFLVVNWTQANGKVDHYNASLAGVTSNITKSLQVNFTNLQPGKEYTATVQSVSGNCSQTSAYVTEATYPTHPRNITFTTVGTNNLTLSWMEPVDMSDVMKSYNISYGDSIDTWTVTNATNVVLQHLTSGTKYSITVATIGVRGYHSLPVGTSVYTKPLLVKSLQASAVTSYSVFLVWSKPDEYNTSYSYRVQTNGSSPATVISTVVTNTSATIKNLTPGKTYTFMVYTRAADNVTESDGVLLTICTDPEKAFGIKVTNNNSTDTLGATWSKPDGIVDGYKVNLTGDVSNIIQTNSTQVTFTGLLPGREYKVTVETVSGTCRRISDPETQATYPTPPRNLTFNAVETNNLTLSWMEPIDMSSVMKSYIIYWSSSGSWSMNNTGTSVVLQNLISGTNYSISVVTVGVRGYLSSPVSASVYTKPMPVQSLQISDVTSNSVSLTWNKPDEHKTNYSYRVQTNVTSPSTGMTIVTNESATIMDLTPGETYTFVVYTRAADNITASGPVDVTTCTVPEAVHEFTCTCYKNSSSLHFTWDCPRGRYIGFNFSATRNKISVNNAVNTNMCRPPQQSFVMQGLSFNTIYTVNMTTLSLCGKSSREKQKQCSTCIGSPSVPGPVIISIKTPTYYSFKCTFEEFDSTNGPIQAYAVVVSSVTGAEPSTKDLLNTYSDFKKKHTLAYVAMIKKTDKTSQRSSPAVTQTVTIGDNSEEESSYYKNGPLNPASQYWVGIAGFTSLELEPNGRILFSESLFSFAPYHGPIKTTVNVGMIAGAVVGSILGLLVIALIGYFIWRKRRKRDKTPDVALPSINHTMNFHAISTTSFNSHYEMQRADSDMGFSEEYEKLAAVGIKQTKSAAEMSENREKNRYTNVLPYDVSRVLLSSSRNITQDYINANYIPGYNSPRDFIAAQGPLPKTINDFWRMIWEKDVQAIVMLTKCAELGKVKCEEYWPQRSTKMYGDLSISMTDENILENWATRDFTLVNIQTRQSNQVRQFHFTAWPDFGVPKTTSDLIRFRNLVRDYTAHRYPLNSPVLVHCSAGVGRTGTFIALDRIIRQIEAEDQLDVFGTVYDLRMHRGLMVQTEKQYIFLNQCVLDFINTRNETNPDLIYQNTAVIYQNVNNLPINRTNL